MDNLEYFYFEEFNYPKILDRKTKINSSKTIIFSQNKTGKTYLALSYIKELNKPFLWIDFSSFYYSLDLLKNIESFIKEKNLEVIFFDNFDFSLNLPDVKYILITTTIYKKLNDFDFIELNPLDFEEFISFEKNTQITQIFNNFLKYGNLPINFDLKDNIKLEVNKLILKELFTNQTKQEILKYLIKSINTTKSNHQIYTYLKRYTKISKDSIYKYIKELSTNKIIFLVEKYNHPKSAKKIFTFNPIFLNLVNNKKNLNQILANFVFLELFYRFKEIYYLEKVDFYIPKKNLLIFSIPFFNKILFNRLIPNIIEYIENLGIKNIQIVTISQEEKFFIQDIEVEVLPFYEWALI